MQKNLQHENLNIEFKETIPADRQGYQNLLKRLEYSKDKSYSKPEIFIFDRDIKDSEIAQIHDENKGFKSWENGLYSFVLPIPTHRNNVKDLCIEHYYTDDEIKTKDENGRRLFISGEFDSRTCRHNTERDISTTSNKVKKGEAYIIDDEVYDSSRDNIALSKEGFAASILSNSNNFSGFNFSEFSHIFKVIEEIIVFHYRKF